MKTPALTQRWLNSALKYAFTLLYHEMSWSYDFVAACVSLGRWKSWVLTCLGFISGPLVLELGHGTGHLQAALDQRNIVSIGIDKSQQMGKIAKRNLRRTDDNVRLINSYAQALPFESRIFSQVVATFPSEYIFDPHTLAEITRVLTPGGLFVIVPLAWITGRSLPERIAAWLFRFTGQTPPESLNEAGIAFERRLSQAGFITRSDYIDNTGSIVLVIKAMKPAG